MPTMEYIYLDNCSTTKVDPMVLEALLPYLEDNYGNSSSNHVLGKKARKAVENAREKIAEIINADAKEIIFTSGATESINLALKGLANAGNNRSQIVTVTTEHKAVLDTCKYLEDIGFEVVYVPVNQEGLVDFDNLKNQIDHTTLLVSVMTVNNETGVVHHIKEISKLAHENGAFFMTDATQAFGKMSLDVEDLGIDLMAFSAHKIYGPKGVGAFYINKELRKKKQIFPIHHGGGHEDHIRSGTLNVPGIVGFGEAAELANHYMDNDKRRIEYLRNKLESKLLELPNTSINGSRENRLYNVSNILFKHVDSQMLMSSLKNIIVSNGSACTSRNIEPSHVLQSMGLDRDEANSSIRFSIGRFNTEKEIDTTIDVVVNEVERIRNSLAVN